MHMPAGSNLELVSGRDLHEKVIVEAVLQASDRVWIATADLKDLHVRQGRRYVPILGAFAQLARDGVRFRVIHASDPSRPFRDTLDQYPLLTGGAMELQVCPRSHWKMVLVDGDFAYFHALVERVIHPHDYEPSDALYASPPRPEQVVSRTFCGT